VDINKSRLFIQNHDNHISSVQHRLGLPYLAKGRMRGRENITFQQCIAGNNHDALIIRESLTKSGVTDCVILKYLTITIFQSK
jgi:hypothetical protein